MQQEQATSASISSWRWAGETLGLKQDLKNTRDHASPELLFSAARRNLGVGKEGVSQNICQLAVEKGTEPQTKTNPGTTPDADFGF